MSDMTTYWRKQTAAHRLIIFFLLCLCTRPCMALWATGAADSTFTVERFRQLDTDVSAFIDAVRDLNGEACALVKVVAPPDFAFSSPLGIVKRCDEVGEIWLYLPKGTKQLTIKHPLWGVLRNWPLGMKLESRMTYELRLRLPTERVVEKHDTIVYTQTVTDTVTIAPPRRVIPLHAYALVTASLHTDGPSWGVMLALMRRMGGYLHASTNLCSAPSAIGTCDKDGIVTSAAEGSVANTANGSLDSSVKPYYTGRTRTAAYVVTAGLVHRLGQHLSVFEGVGYGQHTTSWQLSASNGGGWLRNDGLSHKGMAAELGVMVHLGRVSVSASALTIAGKQWQGGVGIGVRLFKGKGKGKVKNEK